MSLFETIGIIWCIFTSSLASVGIFYFAWRGLTDAWRQRERGECEERLDIQRARENKFLEGIAQ